MGRRLKSQRRGKGGPTFRATKKAGKSSYPPVEKSKTIAGQVLGFEKKPGRNGLLARILTDKKEEFAVIAAEGMFVGQEIEIGEKADLKVGNIMPLSRIPEGCPVFNVEMQPGDGGRLVRSTGSYSLVVSKTARTATIRLPSGKNKALSLECRAMVGNAACGERTEKPLVKAGNKYYFMKAKSRPWPIVRGVAMNASDHPYGGEQHHAGKSKSVARGAPPGRKVGQIASKRTGRRKRK